MIEEWRVIKDFPNYEVSNMGRVRKIAKLCNRDTYPVGSILVGCDRKGYRAVGLRKPGGGEKREWKSIHLLVLKTFVGPAPEGRIAHHKDSDTSNNCQSNLEWATLSENVHHAYVSGSLDQRGERNNCALLKEKEVVEIKKLLSLGTLKQKEIGERFGVARNTITQIKCGINWGYLEG